MNQAVLHDREAVSQERQESNRSQPEGIRSTPSSRALKLCDSISPSIWTCSRARLLVGLLRGGTRVLQAEKYQSVLSRSHLFSISNDCLG